MPMFDAETLLFLVSPCFTLIWVPPDYPYPAYTKEVVVDGRCQMCPLFESHRSGNRVQLQSRSHDLSAVKIDIGWGISSFWTRLRWIAIQLVRSIQYFVPKPSESPWIIFQWRVDFHGHLFIIFHHYYQHDRLQIVIDILPAINYISLKRQRHFSWYQYPIR